MRRTLAALAASLPLVASASTQPDSAYSYEIWSKLIKSGQCSDTSEPVQISLEAKSGPGGSVSCSLEDGIKSYRFPAGIFEIEEQLLVPERTSITGAKSPNDMANPTRSPDWREQTLFLATRGAVDYNMNYCHAKDMVTTRVGFVLSSNVTVRDLSYQGADTIRPFDNGGLCGGGAFETKGCAENACHISDVNNGGSDGMGSIGVTIENVRLNDFYFAEDDSLIGVDVPGNGDCKTEKWDEQCCFCKPNGVRSTQVGVWVPQSRNAEGTRSILIKDIVSRSTQGDGINLHGYVQDALVINTYFENTGDDVYALWGAGCDPIDVVFKDLVAVNPGILRPKWYGVCVATYGLKSVLFQNITCRTPTLKAPILSPSDGNIKIDMTMFDFHGDFSAQYPADNSITIDCWTFTDLNGKPYTPDAGTLGDPEVGKMVWTQSGKIVAPYFVDAGKQQVNVNAKACPLAAIQATRTLDSTLASKKQV